MVLVSRHQNRLFLMVGIEVELAFGVGVGIDLVLREGLKILGFSVWIEINMVLVCGGTEIYSILELSLIHISEPTRPY